MTDKERLEIIKFLRNSEKTVAPGMQPSELISRKDVDWLINRVEELEEENDELAERVHKLALDWSELVDERNRYKQALEFYADEEHYKEKLISEAQYDADGICISNDEYAPPIIYFDSGEKARQALEGDDD